MVASEPYLLWVIEGPSWLPARLPLAQAGLDVIFTKDLKPYREQKVHLLNGPHTAMASLGLLAGLQTVEEVMKDADFSAFVRRLMDDEPAAGAPFAQTGIASLRPGRAGTVYEPVCPA